MKKQFVDTNIFVYTLFQVDKQKHHACVSLFAKAANEKLRLWTTEWVIAELVWFLTKQKLSWGRIKAAIEKVLVTKGLALHNKDIIQEALATCRRSEDFNDSMHIALARKNEISSGYSYDKGLDRWEGFERREP